MRSSDAGLAEIAREFLLTHEVLGRTLAGLRRGEVRFEEVARIADDSEESPLFRLKERCHALFRPGVVRGDLAVAHGALFDLAVGSLFHETMKLRENFYQLAVYAPKVDALRASAGPESDHLFREFARILDGARVRLDEALHETELLLAQTRDQFGLLVEAHRHSGLLARFLLENADRVEAVMGAPLDGLFERVHGEQAEGYALAARSYLGSGYFEEARGALGLAIDRDEGRSDLRHLLAYAEGMSAYLAGRYEEAVAHLERWLAGASEADVKPFAGLARSACARVGELVPGAEREVLVPRAGRLAERLDALLAGAKAPVGA